MTTSPVLSAGQQFFGMVLKDMLTIGGGPLLTFLNSFSAAAGDPVKIEAALLALQGAEIGQLTPFEALLSSQIAGALSAKLQAAMAKP